MFEKIWYTRLEKTLLASFPNPFALSEWGGELAYIILGQLWIREREATYRAPIARAQRKHQKFINGDLHNLDLTRKFYKFDHITHFYLHSKVKEILKVKTLLLMHEISFQNQMFNICHSGFYPSYWGSQTYVRKWETLPPWLSASKKIANWGRPPPPLLNVHKNDPGKFPPHRLKYICHKQIMSHCNLLPDFFAALIDKYCCCGFWGEY